MAPLSWEKLMELDLENLQDDTSLAEDMCNVLEEFDPGGQDKVEYLCKLFEVTRTVMSFKATQALVAEEELSNILATEGKSNAKLDQEMEDLRSEIQILKRNNKDLKRGLGDTPGAAGGRGSEQSRLLSHELNTMESQLVAANKDTREKDKALREQEETTERYFKRAEDAEKELRELKRENDRLQDAVRNLERQLESQRDALISRRDDDSDIRGKISQKNKILVAALEENRNLAEHNVELETKLEDLKKELKEGQAV